MSSRPNPTPSLLCRLKEAPISLALHSFAVISPWFGGVSLGLPGYISSASASATLRSGLGATTPGAEKPSAPS